MVISSARMTSDCAWLPNSASVSGPPATVTVPDSIWCRRSAARSAVPETSSPVARVTRTSSASPVSADGSGGETSVTPGMARTSALADSTAAHTAGSVAATPVTSAVSVSGSGVAPSMSSCARSDSLPMTVPTSPTSRSNTRPPTAKPAPTRASHSTITSNGRRMQKEVIERNMRRE